MKTFFYLLIVSLSSIALYAGQSSRALYSIPARAQHSERGDAPWGVDASLVLCPSFRTTIPPLKGGRSLCVQMIRGFQNYISPIDGPRSSFYPTSSQYALEAIAFHGVLTGIALGCDRLLRENRDWWVYDTTFMHGIDRKLDPVRY